MLENIWETVLLSVTAEAEEKNLVEIFFFFKC